MSFKWNDYEEAVKAVYEKIIKSNSETDVIQWAFDNLSNKEEERMEQAWEHLMVDVMKKAEEEEKPYLEELKKCYEELNRFAEMKIHIIDTKEKIHIKKDLGDLSKDIENAKMKHLMFKIKAKRLVPYQNPNWLKRVIDK